MKVALGIEQAGRTGLSEAAANVARQLRRPTLAPVVIACVASGIDVFMLSLGFWFAQYAALEHFAAFPATLRAVPAAGLTVLLLAMLGGYGTATLGRPARGAALALFAALAPALAAFASGERELAAAVLIATALLTLPLRTLAAAALRWAFDAGLTGRRAVVAGGGENAALLIRGLAARPENNIRIHGLFDDRDDARSPEQILGVPKLGTFKEVVDFARVAEIDLVIVTLPLDAEDRINWLLRQFRVLPVEVRLSAFSRDFAFADGPRDDLISLVSRSFSPERRLAKRSFDLVLAALALIVLSPVMLLAALAVKLDSPGPVFFRQRRHGFNDRVVDVLKFRSMYADAADPAACRVVTRDDPRVTRVGRILRKTSIDELPQLFNVLGGQLSLVGPRPHAVEALSSTQMRFSQMVEGYSARHRLPPGITGWAQINGWRGEVDDPEKLRARFAHDLWYIENWSLWLDLMILLRTPLSLFDTRSAY
jgi:Undecaprenyl-phosphate glucose phosphotransferase